MQIYNLLNKCWWVGYIQFCKTVSLELLVFKLGECTENIVCGECYCLQVWSDVRTASKTRPTSRLFASYSFIPVIHCSLVDTDCWLPPFMTTSVPVTGTNFTVVPVPDAPVPRNPPAGVLAPNSPPVVPVLWAGAALKAPVWVPPNSDCDVPNAANITRYKYKCH